MTLLMRNGNVDVEKRIEGNVTHDSVRTVFSMQTKIIIMLRSIRLILYQLNLHIKQFNHSRRHLKLCNIVRRCECIQNGSTHDLHPWE